MESKESALIVLGLFLMLLHPSAAGASGEGAGEAFSDPAVTQEMPESWVNQPIKHDPALEKADVVVTLNRQVYQALTPLIVQFEKENGVRVVVTKGTCGISAGMVRRKEADIVMLCCPPGKIDRLPGIEFHTVGIMSLAVLVHPENPVDDISLQQVRQVFRGDLSRWSDLSDPQGRPGKNSPIQVVARRHCRKRPGHWKLLLGDSDLFSPKIQEVGAIPDMIQLIADNPSAIGYEVMQMVREYEDKGELKPLRINGFSPEGAEQVLSGEYPFYRAYSITTWRGDRVDNPHARRLVEHILAEVEKVEKTYGIIPASDLRKAGWKFSGNELTGGPE